MSALLCCVRFKHLKCQINATGMFSQMLPLRRWWISALWLACTKPLAHLHENIYKVSLEVMREDVKAEETSSLTDPGIIFAVKSTFLFTFTPYVCNVLQFKCIHFTGMAKIVLLWRNPACLAVEFGQMAFFNVMNKGGIYRWNRQSLKCLNIRSVGGSDRALSHIMICLLQIFAF